MSNNNPSHMEAWRKRNAIKHEFQREDVPGTIMYGWNITMMLDEIVKLRAERAAALRVVEAARKVHTFHALAEMGGTADGHEFLMSAEEGLWAILREWEQAKEKKG